MHVFHFKIYISAVFSLIAMNFTPYSPTVTEFAALLLAPSCVWMFGQVVAITLSLNDLTIWVVQ